MFKTQSRIAFFAGLLVVLAIALSVAKSFPDFPGHETRLPTWDPSAHGMDGVMLTDAIKNADPLAFFRAIYLMSYWPPAYPLLEVPAFLLRGYDFHVARDTVAALYVFTVLAAFAAGFFVAKELGLVTGLITAALVAASPYYKLYANLEMAEIPSSLFLLLALAGFFAYQTRPSKGALRAFCLSLTILFFTKYNNALLVFIALGLFHFRDVWATLRLFWESRVWKKSFYVFAGVYLIVLAGIFLAGGVSFDAFGRKVFIRTVGNPLYVLIALVFLRWLLFRREEAKQLLARLRALPDPYVTYFKWVAVPVALWMINPNNLRTFFLVVVNEAPDERPGLLATLTYYPKVILDDYVGSTTLGVALFLLAAAPLLWLRRLAPGQKFLYLFGGLSLFLCAIHQNTSPRYVFPLVPLIFLAAAFAMTRPLVFLSQRVQQVAVVLLTCGVVWGFWRFGRDTAEPARLFEYKTSAPGLADVVDFLCDHAKASKGESTLVGFWDELPPGLVQWRCRQAMHDVPYERIPKTPNRAGIDYYAPDFEKLLANEDVREVYVARYRTDPPQTYLMHYRNVWLLPLVDLLAGDQRFVKLAEREFQDPWYQVQVYQRR